MAETRVLVTDRAGNTYAKIPSGRAGKINLELTGVDSLTLAAFPNELAELALVDREIQVWVGDEPDPRFVGVPFTASKGLDAARLSIPVLGLEAYLGRWHISDDLAYTNVDQHTIGAQILSWAQARPDGDANIDVAGNLSGVTRTRDYQGDELANVLDVLHGFRGLVNGYDWSIVYSGASQRIWTPYHPRRGTARPWHLRYRPGRSGNVSRIGYDADGSQVTRKHHATSTGTGEGPAKLIGTYLDPTLAGSGRLLLESTSSESTSISDFATLVEHAQARVEATRNVARTWEAEVTDPTIAMTVGLGDTFTADLTDGWQAFDGTVRVIAIGLDPVSERAVLSLTEEP